MKSEREVKDMLETLVVLIVAKEITESIIKLAELFEKE